MIGITGHRGVLGTLLKEKLSRQGVPCSGYDGDIRDSKALNRWIGDHTWEAIFHFAAKVPVQWVRENPFDAYAINVGGCLRLGEALLATDQRPYLLYASSSHVYASKREPIAEEDPVGPINQYGQTKYQGEVVLDALSTQAGIPVCRARIFSFYSDRQAPGYLYPAIKRRLQTEDLSKPFRLMGARSIRDLSPAMDIADRLLAVYERRATGAINIGSGRGIRIMDFVQSLAPCSLTFEIDENEEVNHLVADVSKLNQLMVIE
ncbi:MAG TPA: NAD(P)-dependent oxidoreductase [Kiritimatiellia bacterium]|nr:NAD(P)-dependent oxidoreductase [Kiritimatiellia bacterium]HMO98693.1 NAD(P)-dependent oxidoreductase [Kiritimatiellia bacterium]